MLLVFVLLFSLLESIMSINAVVSVPLAFLVLSLPKTIIGTDFTVYYCILCTKWMKSTRHGPEDYVPEEKAITLAVAAVHAANNSAAASGRGGESNREAVVEAIYVFAASFDADDDSVAMGGYNVDNSVVGGRGQKRRKVEIRCCCPTCNYYTTSRFSLARDWSVYA